MGTNNEMIPSKEKLANAVQVIKDAILQSQQRALGAVNQEQLALYYGVGRYISANTRTKNWGKGFIEGISEQLQKELPGLRGFSAPSLRKMRTFYEEWRILSDDSFVETNKLTSVQFSMASDFPIAAFMNIGFSHHYAILSKVKRGSWNMSSRTIISQWALQLTRPL
jgi:hypothetical protein